MTHDFLPRIETDIQPTAYKIMGYRMTHLEPDPNKPPALISWRKVAERPQTAITIHHEVVSW